MSRSQIRVLVLMLALGGLCWVGLAGGGVGAETAPTAQLAAVGSGPPLITDPLHHLSGVVAVPARRVLGAPGARGPWGPLTLPVFGPNVDASLNNPAAQNETTIAINPEDDTRVIAAANDYRCNLCPYVYLSTNSGTAWTNYPVPGAGSLFYGDPAMTFGTGSNAYFGYLGYAGSACGGGGGMYNSRSTDAGLTFSPPLQLAANSNNGTIAVLQDKEYVAVDTMPGSSNNGNVYEGWTHFAFLAGPNCGDASTQVDASTIFSRSTDHGISWSVPITASPPISNNNQGTVPAIGRHGEVYLYYLGAQTQSQLNYDTVLFSRSIDGGQTFPFFTHIASIVDLPSPLPHTSFRDNAFGAMAVDQQIDGYLYAVWSDYRTGDADILLSRSTDNGTTWGPPQRVNDDSIGNGKDQFFPWIATAPDGRLHIAWLDRRDDPNDANYKEYYTDSLDHGVTFEPNIAVSTAPSVPGSSGFIGDYTGLAATTGIVMPVWTDIRTGTNQNAYTARGVVNPSVTPTPSNTATSTSTGTTTATGTATVSSTPVANTATTTPTASGTPTATGTAPATRTSLPSPTPLPSATPCALSFTDVQVTDYFYTPVLYLACRGVISGYSNGDGTFSFRPYTNTTRAQMVKIVVLGFNTAITTPAAGGYTFADVQPANPFFAVIETAASGAIVSGYTCGGPGEPCDSANRPYFRPYASVTRGQLSKIDVVAAGWSLINPPAGSFADVPPQTAFYEFVETAVCRGVISGYTCGGPGEPCDSAHRPYFRQYNQATRGQIAKIVYLSVTGGGTCAPPAAPQ